MQQIWKDGTDWDECLKQVTFDSWLEFLGDYSFIEMNNIPRWGAATLYSKVQTASGEFVIHFVAAKTKVASINVQNLPSLATLLENSIFTLEVFYRIYSTIVPS